MQANSLWKTVICPNYYYFIKILVLNAIMIKLKIGYNAQAHIFTWTYSPFSCFIYGN